MKNLQHYQMQLHIFKKKHQKMIQFIIEKFIKNVIDIYYFIVNELNPLFDPKKIKENPNLSDKEMFTLLMLNQDEIENFLKNIEYIKQNQKYLEVNNIDTEEKIKIIKPLETKSMDLESKMTKMTDNIDNLLKNYTETIDIINKKFELYNELLGQK